MPTLHGVMLFRCMFSNHERIKKEIWGHFTPSGESFKKTLLHAQTWINTVKYASDEPQLFSLGLTRKNLKSPNFKLEFQLESHDGIKMAQLPGISAVYIYGALYLILVTYLLLFRCQKMSRNEVWYQAVKKTWKDNKINKLVPAKNGINNLCTIIVFVTIYTVITLQMFWSYISKCLHCNNSSNKQTNKNLS